MLSALAKAYAVLAGLLAVAAVAYIHPLSVPSKGHHDKMGGALLVIGALAAVALAVAASLRATTDTDLERPVPADAPPPARHAVADAGPAVRPAIWPFVAAVGLVPVAVSAAQGTKYLYLGLAILAVAGGGWLAQSFTEHPLVTRRLEARVAQRTVGPFSYPVLAILLGAVVAISVSRIYLTVTEHGAVVVSGVVAGVLFLGCLVLAAGQNVGTRLTALLGGLALVSVVGAGVASGARGERAEEKAVPDFTSTVVKAQGIQYDVAEVQLTEGNVKLTFQNYDPKGTYHDFGIYSAKVGGTPYVAANAIDGGKKRTTTINTDTVGLKVGETYWFRCDFHPAMVGTLTVAPKPTGEQAAAEKKG